MYTLMVENDLSINYYVLDSKEEIEEIVEKSYDEDTYFSIALTELQIFCDWEDRFDFGW